MLILDHHLGGKMTKLKKKKTNLEALTSLHNFDPLISEPIIDENQTETPNI